MLTAMAIQIIYIKGLLLIIFLMTSLWLLSLQLRKASIVDPFWGLGFVVVSIYYSLRSEGDPLRQPMVLVLSCLWGIRLFVYLFWRNYGKPEDYRYAQFRKDYGAHRYWWVSFFQVFLLQGFLLWLISAPLLTAQYYHDYPFGVWDVLALVFWMIGFAFEAGGDYQLTSFKRDPSNKGKVLTTGFWRYTRHPNYFGDACVWWSFALFSVAAGSYWPVLSSVLMTFLLMKVSGVSLLERTLKTTKPEYESYIRKTNSFFPWFPKK
jgi:steroid 5-alpha reductase family enzyme